MRLPRLSRRAALIAVAAVFALPTAGVLAATKLRSRDAPTGPPRTIASGILEPARHITLGDVSIVEFPDGEREVVLRNLRTWRVPELYVYLFSTEGGRTVSRKIAPLARTTGDQRYDFPSDVNVERGARIVIWCETCTSAWGEARLKPHV